MKCPKEEITKVLKRSHNVSSIDEDHAKRLKDDPKKRKFAKNQLEISRSYLEEFMENGKN